MKRVLRVCPAPSMYPKIREKFSLDTETFEEQKKIYEKENIVLPGSLSSEISKYGFICLDMLYPDNSYICKWLAENTSRLTFSENVRENFLEVVKIFDPDIVFYFAGASFHMNREFRDEITTRLGTKKKCFHVVYWGDELNEKLYSYSNYFGNIDYALTSSEKYSKFFTEIGVKNKVIGNMFDDKVDYDKSEVSKDIDVLFCGTTGYLIPEHLDRYNLLAKLCRETKIKIYTDDLIRLNIDTKRKQEIKILYYLPLFFLKLFKKILNKFFSNEVIELIIREKNKNISLEIVLAKESTQHPDIEIFNNLKPLSRIFKKQFFEPKILVSEYMRLLKRAKIVVNIHRNEPCDIGNVRCYETTGAGSFLITDRGSELNYFFKENQDFVSFNGEKDLISKINYYLANDVERKKIEVSGKKTCLSKHTTTQRAKQIVESFEELFAAYK